MREPTPPPVVARAPKVARLPRPAPPAPVVAAPEQPLWLHDTLSLEDAPLPHLQGQDGRAVRPWTLGLRA